ARPGEISLAHHGVLFLDELPEFSAHVLDSLRQPLEDGTITISRAEHHVKYPAQFQLIAAMNPCRCGGGSGPATCRRGPVCAERYHARLSGPFLDRIDLFFDTPMITPRDLTRNEPQDNSDTVRDRVCAARTLQQERYRKVDAANTLNAHAFGDIIAAAADLDDEGQDLLSTAASKLQLSARAYYRVLKVARTIADLQPSRNVHRLHLAEALSYRFRPPGTDTA
ncbi:MAG: ATP-binding protein, partial [Henriciella sp.]